MPRTALTVLVADRDDAAARALVAFLRQQEFAVIVTHEQATALAALDAEPVDCLVAALHDRRIDGVQLLAHARLRHPHLAAVLLTDAPDQARAVEAMRRGALDVQTRPVQLEWLLAALQRGLEHRALADRVADMEGLLARQLGLEALSGRSRASARVQAQVRQVAATQAPVLIQGENGAGRSVVARAIHWSGPRRDARFVSVACEALPESLADSELFGTQAGDVVRPGRVELAEGGTLFLEEVSGLTLGPQRRLMRVLQRRAFERMGGAETIRADVRILASTRFDLQGEVAAGRFRGDLYEALSALRIEVPPLRERREDIAPLAEGLVREAARAQGRRAPALSAGLLERLTTYDWPGNVRELKHVIEDLVLVSKGQRVLEVAALPAVLRAKHEAALGISVGMTQAEAERRLITATLAHAGGDKRRAAATLGMPLRTLYRRLTEYGLHGKPRPARRPASRPMGRKRP